MEAFAGTTRAIFLLCVALLFASTCAAAGDAKAAEPIRYELDLRQPITHLVGVRMTVADAAPSTEIQFPSWNALYQIRDFVRHVQELHAACDGRAADLIPVDIDTWRTGPVACRQLEVRYGVYADEESVFSAVLNDQHAFLNLAQVLFYLPAERDRAVRTKFLLPEGWKLATPLDQAGDTEDYAARNYDRLVDSPVEAGRFAEYSYEQSGAEYRVVVYAEEARYSPEKLLESLKRITATETGLMQDVPFRHYTFFLHFLPVGGGGMEHADGAAIAYPAAALGSNWEGLETTLAHEFFHLWNVKRIRPQGLEPVDYVHGNDTRDLWFSEGVTSTYEELVLVRSGLISRQDFYGRLAREIGSLQERPARLLLNVELAGLDAWLEGYPDYFRPERSISYYNKGALIGFLLDLAIRQATGGRESLDDLMRALNRDFAQRGRFFQDRDLVALIAELTGGHLDAGTFFGDYVTGLRELDYGKYLGYAGLKLTREAVEVPAWGFQTSRGFGGPVRVESVESGSEAEQAGLRPGDVLTTLNGQPLAVPPAEVAGVKPGDKVKLEVERHSRKLTLKFSLGGGEQLRYRIQEDPRATAEALRLRDGWLQGKAGEAR
jgi:predicted metalloprotease with PDZ domain